ncbi:MAG: ornithine cyclodeaminase family protein [Anaerolineae bacterium]|nr:ornithine cyclodeaminase family protein [Anaerolineae bacterium]
MRILTAADIRATITMREVIDAMREAFIALSTGKAQAPLRNALQAEHGVALFMPSYLEGAAYGAVKMVSVYGENPQRFGLPTILASVLVYDAANGKPVALLDGTFLTTLRTGAASGLATELLARPDSAILGVIGAGGQARMQIEAVCAVRPIREVRIYSRSGAASFAQSLAAEFPEIEFRATPTADDALIGADVLVAATTSSTPVILAHHVRPGVHINGIGSYTLQMQEVAAEVVIRAMIVVDSRISAQAEAGDLMIPLQQGMLLESRMQTEIGEIAAGLKTGRQTDQEITFFKSVGTAVQDAAAAARIVAAAERLNLGTVVEF